MRNIVDVIFDQFAESETEEIRLKKKCKKEVDLGDFLKEKLSYNDYCTCIKLIDKNTNQWVAHEFKLIKFTLSFLNSIKKVD